MKGNRRKPVFAGIALLAISSVSFGQTPEADRQAAPEEEIEEIVVYGEKSLLVLKHDIERASDVVFESFNVLNDDDEFDIHCSNRVPTGSKISKGSCRPNFEDQIYSEVMQRQLDMTDGNVFSEGFRLNQANVEAKLKKKKKILDAKMEALANENPEFAKAIIKLYIAEQIFAAEKARRCAGRIICSKNAPDLEPSLNSED
jgi:hypothetical protein